MLEQLKNRKKKYKIFFFQFFMTVPTTRQPNIDPGLKDQNKIYLTLFNTILETANTQAELERSWVVIEKYISV
jgi:hypothetical protein